MTPRRRELLAGVAAAALLVSVDGEATLFKRGAAPSRRAPVVQNATLTIVNTSSSTQPANTVTPTFGHVFKKGDIPSGTAPQFTIGAAVQPMSWGLQTFWSDGSLKFASFMLRLSVPIAGNGSQAIIVSGGGSAPTPSARTLTEVYAQNHVVSMPAHAIQWPGATAFSGTWHSYLANDSNNYQVRVWLDGDAGKAWGIDTKVAQTPGGTPDPWMRFSHFIVALTNASGGLGGFRWMGWLRQPIYNSGTNMWPRAFTSALTWAIGAGGVNAGPNNIRWPFASAAFTCTLGATTTNTKNTFWNGATVAGNCIPCTLSGISGTLSGTVGGNPITMDTNTIYFVQDVTVGAAPATNAFGFKTDATASTGINLTTTGTGTINPMIVIQPTVRICFANADGKYNFFQGTGSFTADHTSRTTIDTTYWQSTKTLFPADLSYAGNSVVPDTIYFTPAWNLGYDVLYSPYNIASSDFNRGAGGGDHSSLGVLPNEHVTDFFLQTNDSERLSRYYSLTACIGGYDLEDLNTHSIMNLTNRATYVGMPAGTPLASWQGWGNQLIQSAVGGGCMGMSTNQTIHKPQYSYWPYLRHGQLSDLDLLVAEANSGFFQFNPTIGDQGSRNPTYLGPAYAIATGGATSQQFRAGAWTIRDVAYCAGIYPNDPTNAFAYPSPVDPTHPHLPFGQDITKYYTDLLEDNAAYMLAFLNPVNNCYGPATSFTITRGAYLPRDGSWVTSQGIPFNYCYMAMAWCVAAGLCENANAKLWLGKGPATYMTYITSTYGGWHLPGYNSNDGQYGPGFAGGVVDIADMNIVTTPTQWCNLNINSTSFSGGAPITWSSAVGTPHYTGGVLDNGVRCFTMGGIQNSYVPGNGDIWNYISLTLEGTPDPTFGGFNANQSYYMVDWDQASGKYNLSATPGGPGIKPTNNGTQQTWAMQARAHPPVLDSIGFTGYILQWRQVACWFQAMGGITPDTGVIVTDQTTRAGGNLGGLIGGYNTFGFKYATQDHFAP